MRNNSSTAAKDCFNAMAFNEILIGLGANLAGPRGQPCGAIAAAVGELSRNAIEVVRASSVYVTEPIASARMPAFYNAVVVVRSPLPPTTLLRRFKAIERAFGRRARGQWVARPLDIDLLDYRGMVLGAPGRWRPEGLVLPHPRMHVRGFVLVPLAEVAPHWRHPRSAMTAKQLLARRPRLRRGVRRT